MTDEIDQEHDSLDDAIPVAWTKRSSVEYTGRAFEWGPERPGGEGWQPLYASPVNEVATQEPGCDHDAFSVGCTVQRYLRLAGGHFTRCEVCKAERP